MLISRFDVNFFLTEILASEIFLSSWQIHFLILYVLAGYKTLKKFVRFHAVCKSTFVLVNIYNRLFVVVL